MTDGERQRGPVAGRSLLLTTDLRVTPERRQDGRQTPLGPRAERTRQRLIDTAWGLFKEKGYLGTAVSDIVEAAARLGLSRTTTHSKLVKAINELRHKLHISIEV